MNTPYAKQFDAEGRITNPLKLSYINEFPSRRSQRAYVRDYLKKKGLPVVSFTSRLREKMNENALMKLLTDNPHLV